MSIEAKIDALIEAVQANTAALLTVAGGAAAAAAAPAPTKPAKAEKPVKPAKAEKEKPATTATKDPGTDGFGDDGFGDEPAGDDDGFGDEGADEPKNTPAQAKAAFLALRDAAIAAKGKEDGLKVARSALAETGVKSIDSIEPSQADEVVKVAFNHAVIAKVGPKFKELAKAAGVVGF